jgi:hypothetical protein
MGSFLERLHVESVPGLYCTKKFGYPVRACAFLRKGPRRCWKGSLCQTSTRWRFLFYPFSSRPSRLHWVNVLLHWVNFFLHWVNHFLFFFVYLQCNVGWRILLMLDQISTVLARKNDVLSLVLKLNRLACILKHGTPPTAKVTLGRFSLDFVNRQIYIGYLHT